MRDTETTGAAAALEDDLRRRLYLFVRSARRPVSREEAAASAGISRKLAAFHLDKLLERGLLRFEYGRPSGRGGPGAGRTSKLYEPSELEIDISIPERHYDFVGGLLVRAIKDERSDESARESATRVARDEGVSLGEKVRRELGLRPPGKERALSVTEDVLRDAGYEPYRQQGQGIRLYNCPFHVLARQAPELVCAMNRAFIDGLVRGLGNETVEVALEPTPGECCVVLR
ncbi:MAG: helix-turn-helix transcriptional regulator [Actinomycetota bacterium]